MTPLELLVAFAGCILIGGVSALMGLGGGIFLVPLLTLHPDVGMRAAAGIALICTLATSAAGSVALDKAKLANLAAVAHLELAAALGAIVGAAYLAAVLPPRVVAGVFAAVVGYAAWRMLGRARAPTQDIEPTPEKPLKPVRYPLGMLGCGLAGTASGLLGIGGGPIKVPVQTEVMGFPLRIALANSNIMVGITAGVGAAIYYAQGWIPAGLLGPCALGIVLGAYGGGRLAPYVRANRLAYGFAGVLILVTLRMAWKALAPAS